MAISSAESAIATNSTLPYRGRFAPSPTGDLHFGSLFAALGSWLRARSRDGAWLVRLEDLDPPREVPGAAFRILAALGAFGLDSDEPVLFQSTRHARYQMALDRLVAVEAAFQCQCSRTELGTGGMHRGVCVARSARVDRPVAWRVRAPDLDLRFNDALQGPQQQNLLREVGDFVVRRTEGYFAYQLAVVVDDADQGITEIVRGADLLDTTSRQIWLQRLLGLATPTYLHLPVALDADGVKLSKQFASAPVDAHDPLPALRSALHALGFPGGLFAGLHTVATHLAMARREYRDDRLPRVASIPAPVAPV